MSKAYGAMASSPAPFVARTAFDPAAHLRAVNEVGGKRKRAKHNYAEMNSATDRAIKEAELEWRMAEQWRKQGLGNIYNQEGAGREGAGSAQEPRTKQAVLRRFKGVHIDGEDGTVGTVVGAAQQDDLTWNLMVRYGHERAVYEYPEQDLLDFLPIEGSERKAMNEDAENEATAAMETMTAGDDGAVVLYLDDDQEVSEHIVGQAGHDLLQPEAAEQEPAIGDATGDQDEEISDEVLATLEFLPLQELDVGA